MSIVSVSRLAGSPQIGQTVFTNPSWRASGDSPPGRKSTSSGSSTGSWSSGTATSPCSGQCTIGIGAPQYRWRLISQSRSRNVTAPSPFPCSSSQAITRSIDSGDRTPSNGPEFTITPSWSCASVIVAGSRCSPSGWTTTRIGRSWARANSKSRWSWAGTPITAPVPYSISTYGATKTGIFSPFTGFTAWTPKGIPSRRVRLLAAGQGGRPQGLEHRLDLGLRASGLDELGDQRVLGREHEERDPPQRVGAGREDLDGVAGLGDLERDARALRTPDPVALHRDHAFGPLERLHVVEQALRVVGDLEEPLREIPAHDGRAAPLAGAVDHLLVRQDRLVLGAPVGRRVLPVRETAFEQPEEEPLGPPVVLGVAGVEPAGPVERHPQPAERPRLLVDVRVRPLLRVDPALDRGVLRREPERVPPDRMEHVVAAQGREPSHRVPAAERLGMPHVEVARGVGEHVERVEPWPGVRGVLGGPVQALGLPAFDPLRFDLGRVVAAHGGDATEPTPPDR